MPTMTGATAELQLHDIDALVSELETQLVDSYELLPVTDLITDGTCVTCGC